MKQIRKYKCLFPLAYLSNGIALGITILLGSFYIRKDPVGWSLAIFLGASWLIQTWFFRVKHFKESQFVDHKWYKKTHKLNPQQLDQFSAYCYKQSAYIKLGTVLLTFILPKGPEVAPGLFVFFLILAFIRRVYLIRTHKLKAPYITADSQKPYRSIPWGVDFIHQLGTGTTISRYR